MADIQRSAQDHAPLTSCPPSFASAPLTRLPDMEGQGKCPGVRRSGFKPLQCVLKDHLLTL